MDRIKSLKLDVKNHKDNEVINMKGPKPNTYAKLKPSVEKTIKSRHKKVRPRNYNKSKLKVIIEPVQAIVNENSANGMLNALQSSSDTRSTSDTKILRPCIYTMRRRKCLSEISCRYLHSDFPCKYYYLNLPCPQGFSCQFMHNGSLDPKLVEALRSHILDLFSTSPSQVEAHFIQQMYNIEDLSRRLKFFQYNQKPNQFMNETANDIYYNNNKNNNNNFADAFGIYSKVQLPTTNGEIMKPNEKIHDLQNIYEQLKEQEKRLQVLTTHHISNNASLYLPSSNIQHDQQSYTALMNPDIYNELQTENSSQNIVTSNADENTTALAKQKCSQLTDTNIPQLVDNYIVSSEELPLQSVSEMIIEDVLPQYDSNGNNKPKCFANDTEINKCNKHYRDDVSTILNVESDKEAGQIYEDKVIDSNNTSDILQKDKIMDDSLITNKSSACYKTKTYAKHVQNNTLIPQNEILEIDITNDDEKRVESNIKDTASLENDGQRSFLYTNKIEKCKNRVRLRSHTLRNSRGEASSNIDSEPLTATTVHPIKPIRNRRLRLLKPIPPTVGKVNGDISQTNAHVLNKFVQSSDNYERLENTNKETISLQNVQEHLPHNVILSKRFLKRAKIKIERPSPLLKGENDIFENEQNNMPTSSRAFINITAINGEKSAVSVADSFKLPDDVEKSDALENSNSKLNVNIKNHTSASDTLLSNTSKDQFNLGNPHPVLTKLKTVCNTSSEFKSIYKRSSFFMESNLGSSTRGNKYLKIAHSKTIKKVITDNSNLAHPQQRNYSTDSDFNTESSNEQPVMDNTSQTWTSEGNKQMHVFELSSTHKQQQRLHEYEKQRGNKSDLLQEIENVTSKLDLEIQTTQLKQKLYQKEKGELKGTSITEASRFIAENSNYLAHKQYQQQEKLLPKGQPDEAKFFYSKQFEEDIKERQQIAKTCNLSERKDEKDVDEHAQPLIFKNIYEPEKLTSTSSNKYTNAEEVNVEYSNESKSRNRSATHSTRRPINFKNYLANITPISSPTIGNNTIASPSPNRESINFRAEPEIDGRLTYPPMPYILYKVHLDNIQINKPKNVEKLRKTIQLDPRVFRTHAKEHLTTACKLFEGTSNALMPTRATVSACDPRNRTSAVIADIKTPSLSHESAITPSQHSLHSAGILSSPSPSPSLSSSSLVQTDRRDAVPLSLQYNSTSLPIVQAQLQRTPNRFIYACLQRSPWYQSLMSTMKIQINQSISQLVRALNNYHRERIFNPEIIFDVFKIDCAGELLEIMRHLGIFVDANGVIIENRHMEAKLYGDSSCCHATPVNATYSFIQQVLAPNTHCSSAPSTYSAPGQFNINEPFVSCYIKASELVKKHSDDSATTHHSHNDDKINRNYDSSHNEYRTNYNDNIRYSNQYKKPHENKSNTSLKQRSNQRYSNYNNNPRFMKPSCSSPTKSKCSSPASSRSGEAVRSRGGHFKNRRFDSFKNNTDTYDPKRYSSLDSYESRYSNKYQNNSRSRVRKSSSNSSRSPFAASARNSVSTSERYSQKSLKNYANDEEC